MKARLTLVLLAAIFAACAPIERSRSLNNPAVPAGAMAMQVCSNCHGLDGNSVSPNIPRLAGQTRPYLTEQLKAFRSHGRLDPAGFEYMWGLSRHLSDGQIAGLADYYASQRPVANRPGNALLLADGKAIFDSGIPKNNIPPCSTCHGTAGAGNEQFPRLAGQHADYLVKQLLVFKRTDERPEGAVMKVIAHDLTAHDIEAVADYLQGLVAN
jgi:cytochrome c553